MTLAGKKVIIGITGGISAYKIPNLILFNIIMSYMVNFDL